MKKILTLILALMMVLSLISATVWAKELTDIDDVELRLAWHGDDSDPNQRAEHSLSERHYGGGLGEHLLRMYDA